MQKCHLPKPPRCHHCSRCGCCILNMDHHCDSLGICLGYRNYKFFILLLFYGSVASAYGGIILLISFFIVKGASKVSQLILSLFLFLIAFALHFFRNFYIKLTASNMTTIESRFPELTSMEISLPQVNLIGKGITKYLPIVEDVNPFAFV